MVDRDVAASATAVRIARTPTSTGAGPTPPRPRGREKSSQVKSSQVNEKSNNVESDASAINHVRILLSPLLVVKSSACEMGDLEERGLELGDRARE